jgi:hypothetical protein
MNTFPTQKGVAFVITYEKGRSGVYTKRKLGALLLPNGFHSQKCENTIRRKFRDANAFRVYSRDGQWFFGGSL